MERFMATVHGEIDENGKLILDHYLIEVIDSRSGRLIKTIHPEEFLKTTIWSPYPPPKEK